MQIVIDISEECMDYLRKDYPDMAWTITVKQAILDGVILPENHGRLISADKLKSHIDGLPALPDGNFAGSHTNLKRLINIQPTILEAGKENVNADSN